MNYTEIQSKIQNAQHLDFGTILDLCIKMFKEVWLKGFLLVIIIAVVGVALTFLFAAIGLSSPYELDWNSGFQVNSSYNNFDVIYSLPQAILVGSLSIGLLAGFYKMCKQIDLNESVSEDLFYYFQSGYSSKIFMLGIIYALIATIAQAMFFIPYLYVMIPLSYFAIILSNNPELSETEIVKISFNLGTKKWLITFGLMFVTGILGMLGVIACFIGLLFTISIMYLPVYFVYRDVVGFEDDSEIMKIGTE